MNFDEVRPGWTNVPNNHQLRLTSTNFDEVRRSSTKLAQVGQMYQLTINHQLRLTSTKFDEARRIETFKLTYNFDKLSRFLTNFDVEVRQMCPLSAKFDEYRLASTKLIEVRET